MMILGSHVKMKAPLYVEGSVLEALSYQANALMLYTGAPQNTKRLPMSELHVPEALNLMQENGIANENLIVHAPYLINLANSVKPEVGELAVSFLQSEAERTAALRARYLVVHPGSYTTADLDTGIATAIAHLNELQELPDGVVICLETMAGKGSEIGFRFEQLGTILKQLNQPEHFGICLDTCHIHDAGYDLHDFDAVLQEFDQAIGLEHLKVIHLNDSKNPCGSHKDRHANIGQGTIGLELLKKIAHHPRIEGKPTILETPYIDDEPPYAEEIALLRD